MNETGPVCIPNLGGRARRGRARAGWAALLAAIAVGALLVLGDAPLALRWIVFFPLFGGALGLLQAREGT